MTNGMTSIASSATPAAAPGETGTDSERGVVSDDLDVRPSHVTLRFALGDLRLGSVTLAVREVYGHFLEKPVHVADLRQAYQQLRAPVFGRSVLLRDSDQFRFNGVSLIATYRRYYVDLRSEFPAYLAQFSSRTRSTMQRRIRRFAKESGGAIDWATFSRPDEVGPFLAETLPLSHLTYQHRVFHAGLPDNPGFVARLQQLATTDQWRGWILRLNRRPVAYICAPAIGRTLLYDYVGFDPRLATLSPGTVLQYLVLEQLFCQHPFAFFDFTEGEGEHKSLFATDCRRCADLVIAGTAIRAKAIIAAYRAFNAAGRSLTSAAERLGVRRRLRRLLRR